MSALVLRYVLLPTMIGCAFGWQLGRVWHDLRESIELGLEHLALVELAFNASVIGAIIYAWMRL